MPKLKTISKNPNQYRQCIKDRGVDAILPKLEAGLQLFEQYSKIPRELDDLRAQQNKISRDASGSSSDARQRSKELKSKIVELQAKANELEMEIAKIEIVLPNWIADDVPRAKGDENALPIRYCGIPNVPSQFVESFKANYAGAQYNVMSGTPFHHYQLVGTLVDQETAGNVAQTRFYYEFGDIAILDLAITMYAIEFFKKKGYVDTFMIPPFMMRKAVEERITYFEAFQDTIFEIEKDGLLLIPSSEHSIVAYYSDKIFDPETLPLRVMAWSPCFRREAGAHGKDTRGIFRVKQFSKVELHSFTKNDNDFEEIDNLALVIQEFMGSLGLPNRSVIVASGEMDKRAVKQIDIETWLPAQGKYRETHSIATVGTWVSEKLMLRYGVEKAPKELIRNVYATAVFEVDKLVAIIKVSLPEMIYF